jgi:hypothetical protein
MYEGMEVFEVRDFPSGGFAIFDVVEQRYVCYIYERPEEGDLSGEMMAHYICNLLNDADDEERKVAAQCRQEELEEAELIWECRKACRRVGERIVSIGKARKWLEKFDKQGAVDGALASRLTYLEDLLHKKWVLNDEEIRALQD